MALARINRLKRKKELDLVFKEGNAVKGSFLFIRFRKNSLNHPRFTVIVPAKTYNLATARNRVKRVILETIRKQSGLFKKGYDLVVTVKLKTTEKELITELNKLLSEK